ncbi:MAG: alpha-L-fucosidase [Candidatus Binatia bacterium]
MGGDDDRRRRGGCAAASCCSRPTSGGRSSPTSRTSSGTPTPSSSPARRRGTTHEAYGAGYPYENFRPQFEAAAAAWSPDSWATLFRAAGAHYVVLVTKHHDGYSLWPTAVRIRRGRGGTWRGTWSARLTNAVRSRCMRMGLYYSGGFDPGRSSPGRCRPPATRSP